MVPRTFELRTLPSKNLTCVPVPYELILNPFFCKSLCPSILLFILDEHITAIRSDCFLDSGSKCILNNNYGVQNHSIENCFSSKGFCKLRETVQTGLVLGWLWSRFTRTGLLEQRLVNMRDNTSTSNGGFNQHIFFQGFLNQYKRRSTRNYDFKIY